jgi:hypothetical protein
MSEFDAQAQFDLLNDPDTKEAIEAAVAAANGVLSTKGLEVVELTVRKTDGDTSTYWKACASYGGFKVCIEA